MLLKAICPIGASPAESAAANLGSVQPESWVGSRYDIEKRYHTPKF
jgi:hypothetical protein